MLKKTIEVDDLEAWLITEIFSRVLDYEEVDMFEGDEILRKDCEDFYYRFLEKRGF